MINATRDLSSFRAVRSGDGGARDAACGGRKKVERQETLRRFANGVNVEMSPHLHSVCVLSRTAVLLAPATRQDKEQRSAEVACFCM